jgi:hypothetical protein
MQATSAEDTEERNGYDRKFSLVAFGPP